MKKTTYRRVDLGLRSQRDQGPSPSWWGARRQEGMAVGAAAGTSHLKPQAEAERALTPSDILPPARPYLPYLLSLLKEPPTGDQVFTYPQI